MPQSEQPNIVYKYTNHATARFIAGNRTLRVGRPTEMNDPFDVYIDDLFEVDLKERYHADAIDLVDLLSHDPASYAKRIGVPLEASIAASAAINAGTKAQREALVAQLASPEVAKTYPQLKAAYDNLEFHKAAVVALFRNTGIFCVTRSKSNLLMWSHYADQHRGVAFGFRADIERDSFLRLLEPVTYSDVRPSLYEPFNFLTQDIPPVNPESMGGLFRSLTATKSTQWAYEEELRVVIPFLIPEGRPAVFLPYYATELVELNLGLRVTAADRDELIRETRAVNADVAIFQAHMKRGAFALSFERIA